MNDMLLDKCKQVQVYGLRTIQGPTVTIPVSNELGEPTGFEIMIYSRSPNKTTEPELLEIAQRLILV